MWYHHHGNQKQELFKMKKKWGRSVIIYFALNKIHASLIVENSLEHKKKDNSISYLHSTFLLTLFSIIVSKIRIIGGRIPLSFKRIMKWYQLFQVIYY